MKSSYRADCEDLHCVQVNTPYLIQSTLSIQSIYGSLQDFNDALRKHQTKVCLCILYDKTSDV